MPRPAIVYSPIYGDCSSLRPIYTEAASRSGRTQRPDPYQLDLESNLFQLEHSAKIGPTLPSVMRYETVGRNSQWNR